MDGKIPLSFQELVFVMPNIFGIDGIGNQFLGLAVKLSHGVAICWDGRLVLHTSLCSVPSVLENGGAEDAGEEVVMDP